MADRSAELKARLLATFRVEAADHMRAIASVLESLSRDPKSAGASAQLEDLYRTMHTLKGAARSVGAKSVEAVCQDCETALRRISRGEHRLTADTMAMLQGSMDKIARALEGDTSTTAAKPAAPASGAVTATRAKPAAQGKLNESPSDKAALRPTVALEMAEARDKRFVPSAIAADETIRVETQRIDSLVTLIESLLTPKLALGEQVKDFKLFAGRLDDIGTIVRKTRAGRHGSTGSSDLTQVDDGVLDDTERQARRFLRDLDSNYRAIRNTVDELFAELRRVRMMPAAAIIEAFPQMVRDLAEETGKQVAWHAMGGDLPIDRKVLEFIKDPLIHLVRNAVDHGIESPAQRATAGKPAQGNVGISILRLEGGRVAVRVEDDGKGIEIDRIKEAAVRLRLATPAQIQGMSIEEARELVFRSGLSTNAVVTTLSGNGLGLPIVRERIERLGGQVTIESTPGRGTAVALIVPESIATFRGLLVAAGGQKYLCPIDAVARVARLSRTAFDDAIRHRLVAWNGTAIPFAPLADIVGSAQAHDDTIADGSRAVVIVRSGTEHGAFAVDDIDGEQEVLVKEFAWPIVRARNVSAAGLLGTGGLAFILRPSDLLRSMRLAPRRTSDGSAKLTPRVRKLRILVVDDSLTTRTMERHLFESAGFDVKVAADGIDAWNVLNSEAFDLIVSDIDMPRMNGFELTAKIRSDAKLSELPIVLVTALESREDKEQGLRLGANAYVQKSTFEQSNLLDIVRRLI